MKTAKLYDDVDDDDNRLELPCTIDTVDHIIKRNSRLVGRELYCKCLDIFKLVPCVCERQWQYYDEQSH